MDYKFSCLLSKLRAPGLGPHCLNLNPGSKVIYAHRFKKLSCTKHNIPPSYPLTSLSPMPVSYSTFIFYMVSYTVFIFTFKAQILHWLSSCVSSWRYLDFFFGWLEFRPFTTQNTGHGVGEGWQYQVSTQAQVLGKDPGNGREDRG